MEIHRDSPGSEPEAVEIDRPESPRRFRRLIESSAARRLALPRLGLWVGVIVCLLGLLVFSGFRVVRLVTGWVADQPDQQLPFSKIELVPEPDPWVKGGKDLILDQVKRSSKLGETLRLLDLDLEAFGNAFRLGSPWVKRVVRIERSPGRLKVHLEYRKLVAVVVLKRSRLVVHFIDGEGVPVPEGDIDWTAKEPPYQVRGMVEPLIQIWGVDPRSEPTFGVPWKQVNSEREGEPVSTDLLVVKAARIAEFLQTESKRVTSGRARPKITSLFMPGEPTSRFFLEDHEQNLIYWGKPPGEEAPGEPSAEARWKMLVDFYDLYSPIHAKNPDYIQLTRTGAEIVREKNRLKKEAQAR